MISCIITAYKEPRTICKAIRNMLGACILAKVDYEILVVAPDDETINEARSYEGTKTKVRVIKDPGKGKPTALTFAFAEAKGDVLVLSDGDVFVCKYVIRELLKKMKDPLVGAVSGRPMSLNSRKNKFGYWSHLLTNMADRTRTNANGNFVCSGYLYALRSGIIYDLPSDCLSDDAYISYKVIEAGYKIDYSSSANVFVKYPDNIQDWLAQKKRSTGGFTQLTSQYKLSPKKEMRSFWQEIMGVFDVMAYPQNYKEFVWTLDLIFNRIKMWAMIFWERKVVHKDFNKTWTRINSTK